MELRIPGAALRTRKGTLTIDAEVAAAVRKVATAEGRSRRLSTVISDMLRAYLAAEHPDWKLVNGRKT